MTDFVRETNWAVSRRIGIRKGYSDRRGNLIFLCYNFFFFFALFFM